MKQTTIGIQNQKPKLYIAKEIEVANMEKDYQLVNPSICA